MTNQDILNLPMQENDAGAATIRDYLKALLHVIWSEGEGFSGKRPFGNSGWEHEIGTTLVLAKVAKGKYTIDQDGVTEVHEVDYITVDNIVHALINEL